MTCFEKYPQKHLAFPTDCSACGPLKMLAANLSDVVIVLYFTQIETAFYFD